MTTSTWMRGLGALIFLAAGACDGGTNRGDRGETDASISDGMAGTGSDLPAVVVPHCTGTLASDPGLAAGEMIRHDDLIVGGIYVDRYTWRDADARVRSVSLKKQCAENPGNGGYAIQMTYQVVAGANVVTRTLGSDDGSDGGFGYFVSHEAYRHFSDGSDGTIASKNGEDDSALGKGFPTTATAITTATTAIYTVSQNYYRWGTKNAAMYDDNTGTIPTPAATSEHVRYLMPVVMAWSFAAGSNYPMIRTTVDQTHVPGADLVFFDVRGPYGILRFDEGKGLAIEGLFWGDRFDSFKNIAVPLTWGCGGDWSVANAGARYHALVAGDYEMGLYEPTLANASATADGYSDNRGKAAANISCADSAGLKLPCPGEWPYQSLNYSLDPTTPNQPTTGQKIAWGSSGFYGSSLTAVSAGPGLTQAFSGRPASGLLVYDLCLVADKPTLAQAGNGAATMQSRTAQVSAVAANRAPGGLCAVPAAKR